MTEKSSHELLELPPSLSPWAALLQIFPHDLALAIAPLVQRLDAALGPQHNAHRSSGEPDGFDGLARRGSPEGLLLSEWLLAEEMPDEFLRRAASGEQAFLQTARREPAVPRVCVALFDAGPNQIGAPRLAQIAALVVLARRAMDASTPFFWGVLQHSAGALQEEITAHNVELFLAARSPHEADENMMRDWKSFLLSQGETRENAAVWIVGGSRLRDLHLLEAFDAATLSDEKNRALSARSSQTDSASTRGENEESRAAKTGAIRRNENALAIRNGDETGGASAGTGVAATNGETSARGENVFATRAEVGADLLADLEREDAASSSENATQLKATTGDAAASAEIADAAQTSVRNANDFSSRDANGASTRAGKAARKMAPALFLQLRDEVDLEPRVLATIYANGATPREVALVLPPSDLRVRLLRDPFGTATANSNKRLAPVAAPQSNLVFSHSGQKLLARGEHGAILVYPLPNSPKAGIGATKTRRAQSVAKPFAANRFGRDFLTLGIFHRGPDARCIRIEGGANFGFSTTDCAAPEALKIDERGALLRPLAISGGANRALFFIDDARVVWKIESGKNGPEFSLQALGALALTTSGGHVFYVARASSHSAQMQIVKIGESGKPFAVVILEDENLRAAFFGFGAHLGQPEYGLLAYQREDYGWVVLHQGGTLQLINPPSTAVVGVVALPDKNPLPALVALEKDRRGIALLSRNWSQSFSTDSETSARASSPILSAQLSTQAPVVAYATRSEVVAYSLSREAVLMRLPTQAAPSGES